MSVRPKLVLLLVSLFLSGQFATVYAQEAPLADDVIRRLLRERVERDRRGVGVVVGVLTPDGRRVVAHGQFAASDSRQVDGDTVFEIGSLSKVFTGWLLADMATRGEVTVNDTIDRLLPAGVRITPNADGRSITLADLATHTAGFPFWPTNLRPGDIREALAGYSTEDLFRFVQSFEVPASVGSRWAYSNADAGLLGLLLSRRASTTYEDLLRDRVTTPFALNSTSVTPTAGMRSRMAHGHTEQRQPAAAWNVPAFAGGGSIHSTVTDLLGFLSRLQGAPAQDAAFAELLRTRRPGPGFQQALGWMVQSTSSGELLVHDGQTLGFASAVAYDARTRSGVVVLSNTAISVGDLARHILRPSLPLAAPPAPAPVMTEIVMDPSQFDRYAGRYSPKPGLEFTVTREEKMLMLQIPGLPKLRLRPEREHVFFVAENTRLGVKFQVDASGAVTRLEFVSPAATIAAAKVSH
jgi:D-alanyl-D-alanine-carboxypeptidase/D-alanyl-D-alanine-endopeptidase